MNNHLKTSFAYLPSLHNIAMRDYLAELNDNLYAILLLVNIIALFFSLIN